VALNSVTPMSMSFQGHSRSFKVVQGEMVVVALTSVTPMSIMRLVAHTSDVIVVDVARISMPSSWWSDVMVTWRRSANQQRRCNTTMYRTALLYISREQPDFEVYRPITNLI